MEPDPGSSLHSPLKWPLILAYVLNRLSFHQGWSVWLSWLSKYLCISSFHKQHRIVRYYPEIMISGSLLAKLPKGWCILFMEDRLKDVPINQSTLWNYKKLLNPPQDLPVRPSESLHQTSYFRGLIELLGLQGKQFALDSLRYSRRGKGLLSFGNPLFFLLLSDIFLPCFCLSLWLLSFEG